MAELVSVFTDPITQAVASGTPIVGETSAAADQIVMVIFSLLDPNAAYLDDVTVTLDDLTPVDFKILRNTAGSRAFLVFAFGGEGDGEPIDFIVTVGTAGESEDIRYRGQYSVWGGVRAADADLGTNYVEVEAQEDPLELTTTVPALGDILVAIGGAQFDLAAEGAPVFTPAGMQAAAQEVIAVSSAGEVAPSMAARMAFMSGIEGDRDLSISADADDATAFGLMAFVFRAAGSVDTGFNCECEDPTSNKTLAAYRRDLLIRCGFAANADNPPPGTRELMDAFLRDAQDFLYFKYPALRTRRFFRWTMEEGVRYYGIRSNDEAGIRATVNISVASPAIVTWPDEAPEVGRKVSFTSHGTDSSLPAPLREATDYYIVSSAGNATQIALTPGGTPINTTSAGSGVITAYGFPTPGCIFDLQPYADIEGAWLVDLNGSWLPMTWGIPPTFYTTVSQPGLPVRIEIRQCIEVFPAPMAAYQLYIKGHFGLRPFDVDSDKPTIDGHLVYLWALANALDYYGKPSAAGVATQAQDYLGQLVAGTHTGKRYVPGMRPLPPAIIPIFAPWPGGDP